MAALLAICVGMVVQAAIPSRVAFAPEAVVEGDYLRLGDVADLTAVPEGLRGPAGKLALLRLERGPGRMRLDAGQIADRARRLMPALGPWLGRPSGEVLVSRGDRGPVAVPQARVCKSMRKAVPAGELVLSGEVEAAACYGGDGRDIILDKSGFAVAARDLSAGESIQAAGAAAFAAIRPGQRLTLRVQAGVVTIERDVTAMQAGREGEALFVRTGEGAVFSTRDAR